MSKVVKELMIREMRRDIGDVREVVVVDTSKLNAVATNKWRLDMQKRNFRVLGVKNAVAKKALGEIGLTGLQSVLAGPSTLIWGGDDIVALTKEITAWAAVTKEVEIKGGALGETALTPKDVEALSKSPGRAEILAMLAGAIMGPGAQLAAALNGPGGTIAGQVKSLTEEKTEGGDAPTA